MSDFTHADNQGHLPPIETNMTLGALVIMAALLFEESPSVHVTEAALRSAASEYPAPNYPLTSLQARHSGRVVVDVVVAPASAVSALARVRSMAVTETPDAALADAVLQALQNARFMPFFDEQGHVVEAKSRIVWEFKLSATGEPEVIDPNAPPHAADGTAAQIASDDLRIVRRARELLSTPTRWNRADNRLCPPKATAVSLYCALELATLQITGTFEHRGTVMEDARNVVDKLMPHGEYGHLLMGYNNDPATTFTDIQRVLALLEEHVASNAAR